ncbi:bb116bb2-ad7c-418d-999a-b643c8e1eb28 [Thermothielavioides terrestris]|uniref:Bb116bb2-ad7c-418d-999a-b643c8e1eb28 n=1 Tax=Thermothielavioides terrestris TaxID=2587410 RepID=A0A3S4F021_9PEZI|nr:bb116bb2-ad7c-418d-999a-b643c8e1eb28 [Thermothielavioides terrestris]
MSEILDAIKDAVSPKRREQATVSTYDAQKRGPYAEHGGDQQGLSPPSEAQTNLSSTGTGTAAAAPGQRSGSLFSQTMNAAEESSKGSRTGTAAAAPDRAPKLACNVGFGAPEGTYGPHKSRVANVLDPRVDSDRDGWPSQGLSDYGGAAAKPVHPEGGKYGLS